MVMSLSDSVDEGLSWVFALLIMFVVPSIAFAQGEQKQIPLEYSNPIVLHDTTTGKVYVVHGMADPIFYSSRAHLRIWRFEGLPDVYDALHAQDNSGPSEPSGERFKNQCESHSLNAPILAEVKFTTHGMTWKWQGGNELMGWIQLSSNDAYRVLPLRDLKSKLQRDFSNFISLEKYIETETDEIMNRSFVQRVVIPDR